MSTSLRPLPVQLTFAMLHDWTIRRPPPHTWRERPVVFDDTLVGIVRKRVALCALDRMPVTLAEVFGLFEYANFLTHVPTSLLGPCTLEERVAAAKFWTTPVDPERLAAVRLFRRGDMTSLAALHRKGEWTERLGRESTDFLPPP